MKTHIPYPAIIQFKTEAQKRGYDKEQRAEYVQERKELYSKTAKGNDIITGGALFGTLIPVLKKGSQKLGKVILVNPEGVAKVKNIRYGFKKALKEQLKPYFNEIEKFDLLTNKGITKNLVNGFTFPFKAIAGMCKSIPKPVAIIAGSLLALSTINYKSESNKIDAKHDTIKYLKDKEV